ncbi:MAG: PAS domain S-box protein, partial [Gammaproteobacteria bacterium]|nr:PAS domain S-box protein [Gammaproteobacteria bacterium]
NQVTWSELTYSLFGLEQGKDEESYENFIHCIHPDDRDAVLHAIENCIKNHKGYDIEHRVIWNDGSEHWLHERGNVVRDENGNALRMMGLIHDITETKRNEKYLNKLINQSSSLNDQLLQEHSVRKASEKKLSNILDIAPVAIIVINEHQKITVFNKGAEKIFHYSANELINHPLSALIPDSLPDEVDNQASSLYQVSAFKSLEGKVEVLGRRKDGTEFPCGLNISVIKENDEWFCTVILRDLTGQKKAEQALLKEKREQEELIKKLQDAQDQLLQSEKMASIGQLAAGVAHEINNPVGYINSNIGSLKNYLADLLSLLECYENSEEKIQDLELLQSIQKMKKDVDLEYLKTDIRDLINESEEGVTRVKKIVQDLKDFSHVDEAEWQWTDLHNGLDSTLNIVHNELKYKAEVIKEYGDIPQIECIISQLNQVFMNLLVNAAHAIETRGTITVRTGTEDDGVWVEIEDTGKGMDETTRKRIFDPFFTTKPVGQGTGLGLSLSFGIIQKHSGKIIVTSEPGKGSCFHIWLPVQKSENSEELIQ